MDYDPLRDPDPLEWQRTPDAERVAAVERAHQPPPRRHPPIANLRLHAALHVTVESQLVANSPPEVRQTLSRLMRSGLNRHEAVHAVGEVAAAALARVVQQKVPFEPAAYAAALHAIDPSNLPRFAENDDGG